MHPLRITFIVPKKRRLLQPSIAALALIVWLLLARHVPLGAAVGGKFKNDLESKAITQVHTDLKAVAITFDDGPDPEYTPHILNILALEKAKATFFVIGKQVEMYPQIVARAAAEGHEVENHTYSHKLTKEMSQDDIELEITKTDDLILRFTGAKPAFFRPPNGFLNDTVIRAAEATGHKVVLWTLKTDSMDWKQPGIYAIVNRIVRNVTPGSIIILHDSGGIRKQTVRALPTVIKQLRLQGYDFLTVKQLVKDPARRED